MFQQTRDLQKNERRNKKIETSTIILLSVLSTLGVVAIITMVVVAFFKLGRKIRNVEEILSNDILNSRNDFSRDFDELRREIDSRLDKLNNKIKLSTMDLHNAAGPVGQSEQTKQILQG